MLCTVINGPSFRQAKLQIHEAAKQSDIVELRLDLFSSHTVSTALQLQSLHAIPMIGTLRSVRQGGQYSGSKEEQCRILEQLAACGMPYIDVEDDLPGAFTEKLSSTYPSVKIILSHHNFSGTPDNIESLYRSMKRKRAWVYKMAFTTHNSIDIMRLLLFAKHHTDVLAIGMGPHGQISRILGPIINNPVTFASQDEAQNATVGQLSTTTLCSTYRFRSLTPRTAIYGLIGDPISLSISEITHNALCAHLNLNAVYVKIRVLQDELAAFLALAAALPFSGLSVTMPLKEAIVAHLDYVDPVAQAIGAVNTVKCTEGALIGYNTDGLGALTVIEEFLCVYKKRLVLIGSGGSAKAIAFEALQRGAFVTFVGRDVERAEKAAGALACQALPLSQMKRCVDEGYDVLINCTPSPMPIEEDYILPNTLVMDITTKPMMTPFLKAAATRACQRIYGYQMFAAQAGYQWKLFGPPSITTTVQQHPLLESQKHYLPDDSRFYYHTRS